MPSNRERFKLYVADDGDWHWKLTHENGNEIGGSTEGYENRGDAIENAEDILATDLDVVYDHPAEEFDDWIQR